MNYAQVWKNHPNAILPKQQTEGSVGYDVYALEDTKINPAINSSIFTGGVDLTGTVTLVRTGLVIKPPHGYHIKLLPRSSMGVKRKLIMPHSLGLIDEDYCGPNDEILVPLISLNADWEMHNYIKAGDRIAQIIFEKTNVVALTEVSEAPKLLSRNGVGSTGK